jgi:electron transport complex protein RnfB
MVTVLVIAAIGLICGIVIYVVFVKLPIKVQGIEKTEELARILPGINCGACGYPGCFGLAQALTKDPELITKGPCAVLLQESGRVEDIGKALGKTIDASALDKRALVHCGGNSEIIYDYSGVETCKAAAQLLGGYRKCPYACLGLGDCVKACPQGAISIDPERRIAVVNWGKCNGDGLCVLECPKNLIELVPAATKIGFCCNYQPLRDIEGREKCDFGCTHCRKCFKACEDEAIIWNKERAIPEFDTEKCTLCLKCVIECPPNVLEMVALEEVREKATV